MAGNTTSAAFGTGELVPYVSPEDAAKRVNATITPQDPDWTSTLTKFTELYKSDKTIQQIISENFTHHEARMLVPSDRPDIRKLQDASTERYNALLRGRFHGVERDLVSKFTMMYFGLPVEPMISPLDELAAQIGFSEDTPLYTVQRPLNFLSAHNARNWGKESLRGEEAPCFPIPIPQDNAPIPQGSAFTRQNRPVPQSEPIMGLRGGEASDSEEEEEDPRGEISFGDVLDEPLPPIDYCPSDETSVSPKDEWVYLYGITGCVPFVPRKWRSYATALRQVLHLDHNHPSLAAERPFRYILVHFDRKTKKSSKILHDGLQLTDESPAMEHLLQHFTSDTTSDHADCCAFFAIKEGETPAHPLHWEPQPEQFTMDLTKIGRHVFGVKTGPGKDAISYAYLAFPKTKTASFTIDRFGSNQFNANFRATMDILFGRPEIHDYHHGLFRLLDKNKTKANVLPPIVFGAMGQMQWVWEQLHPLNNPGADWIVDWMRIDKRTTMPVIAPNYYPDPHPHLLSADAETGMNSLEETFDVIQDAITEAFNSEQIAKMESVIVRLGDRGAFENDKVAGFEIPTNRPYRLEERLQLAEELKEAVNGSFVPYLLILPVWRAGESKLFPGWPNQGDAFTDLPPLSSGVNVLFKAVDALCGATNYKNDWRRTGEVILLKSLPPWDSLETPRTESPAFLVTTETTQTEWLAIRSAITACEVSASLLKPSEADWWRSIARSNIWGVRPETGSNCTWLYDAHYTWSGHSSPKIKQVDGNASLPIPRALNKEANTASKDLPFAKGAKVRVDGLTGKTKGRAKQRKSAFDPRKQLSSSSNRPSGPVLTPGGLALPVTKTLRGVSREPEGSWRSTKRVTEVEETAQPESLSKNWSAPSTKRRHVELEDVEELPDAEPIEDPDNERLSAEDDLWGEDDKHMEDADQAPEEDKAPEDEPEGSDHGERYPETGFESDCDYGDDYPSDDSGASDEPVTFPNYKPPKDAEGIDKDDRARTWTTQPGIFEGWDPKAWPSCNGLGIPITAAPVEKVLRTGDSVPMVTKAILTPSEQAELQSSFFTVRGIALKRTMQCPFPGCDFSHRLDEPEAIQKHAKLAHQTEKCMWCDDPLFQWWDPEQRMAHLRKKHEGKLVRALGISSAPGLDKPGSRFTSQRGPRAPMADMTGRPLIPNTSRGAVPDRILQLSSELLSLVGGGNVFQPIGVAPGRVAQIVKELNGLVTGTKVNQVSTVPAAGLLKRVEDLLAKFEGKVPAQDVHPLSRIPGMPKHVYDPVEQRKYFDSLEAPQYTEPPRLLSYPLEWHDMPGPMAYNDPPITCPVPECFMNNFEHLRPKQIWEHFEQKHPGQPLEACPFCRLSFVYSSGKDKSGKKITKRRPTEECIKHFDCHIWKLWDRLEPNKNKYKWPGADFGVKEGGQPEADTSKGRQCAYFEKCGAIVGSMTDKQYRHHMRVSHPKEVPMIDLDSEDEEEARARTPAPTPRPGLELEEETTDASTAKSGGSRKRKRATKPRKGRGTDDESGASSDARSTGTRGRGRKKATSRGRQTPDEDDDVPGSESRSSATQGRERPSKKKKRREGRDDDGEYEDDGATTDDEPEEGPEVPKRPRRARSPDWIRKLGPGDPNFEPSDDMYCSKCLRKAPKSGNKSPNRSPLGREKELEFHSDLNRCCRIRNGEGDPTNLPNRSGWIRAADLPAKLGTLKSRFTTKYPAYDRTIYPTKSSDNNASVWRSDPNNEDNEAFWNMPWPPYEGQPPFPTGVWEDPGATAPVERGRKKKRDEWQGRQEDDPLYRYQSDSDSADDLKPDEDDIAELREDASNENSSAGSGLKRTQSQSGVDAWVEEDEPATKKPKKSPAGKGKKGRKPKKGKAKPASSQPSRASSRVRQRTVAAKSNLSAQPSQASSVAG